MKRNLSIIISLSFIFTTACQRHHDQVIIPVSVQPIVAHFIQDGDKEGRPVVIDDLIIQFGKLDSSTNGKCNEGNNMSPTIILNSDLWPYFDADMREELVFHELGHCVLGRGHTSRTFNLGEGPIPYSIMSPYIFDGSIYKQYHDHYLQELFQLTN